MPETIEDKIYGHHLPDESIRARAEQQARKAIGQDAYDDALDSGRAFDVTETVLFARATANVHHMLAVLSVRFSDQPQRWAVFMGLAGLAALSGSAAADSLFRWVWPPVLLGLVVWMLVRVRRQLPGRGTRWLLYPVLVAAVGGGYETVRESLDARAYPMPGQLIDVGGHRLHIGQPLLVLTADTGHDATWQSAQDHMATLSTNSLHRVAKATTHESLLDDRADSAIASQAIHDVVTAVRTSHRLPPQ